MSNETDTAVRVPERPFSNGTASRKAHAIVNRLDRENPDANEGELRAKFAEIVSQDETLKGLQYPEGHVTEDWLCVDCGINTAPGVPDGKTLLREFAAGAESVPQTIGPDTEMYMVKDRVWAKAGMEPFGGCLCIGCLERRLGRKLKPKDFLSHPFNGLPGSERLLKRRKYWHVAVD